MARLARLAVEGLPHHIIHRGHNLQPVFLDTQDRDVFFWKPCHKPVCSTRLHCIAFVLMDNHVHLLMTPSSATGLSCAMQSLGRSICAVLQ